MSVASIPPSTNQPPGAGSVESLPLRTTAKFPTKYRRNTPRSKNGCLSCRARRRKCDEVKPSCTSCSRSGRECSWPVNENNADQNISQTRNDLKEHSSSSSDESSSPSKEIPGMDHSEAVILAQSVVSEGRSANALFLRASLTPGIISNLSDTSRQLYEQYLSNTADILARGPSADGNPFINYLLPLALSDGLIMDCILGIGGAHMVALDPGKVLADEVTPYFGCGKEEKAQYVLLILLLLCVYEHTQGDVNGSVFHHIKASRHYVLGLTKTSQNPISDRLGHIRGFLLEIYSFMALKLAITPRGAMEDHPIMLDPFLESLSFLSEYKSCGFMLGFGHGLFEMIPEIASLVEKRRVEELNNAKTEASYDAYQDLVERLESWDAFSNVLTGEGSSPRYQQGPAVAIYRTALIVYLHSAFHEDLHEREDLCAEIDLHIDKVLPLMWAVYSSATPFRRMMLWPGCILASFCRRPQLADGFRTVLNCNTRAPGGVKVAAKAMEMLWADPDPRAYGPRGLSMVMKKHGLSFSMG
ncbi:C6 transcription factor [Colletotrichum kahawae]|uniref:C6 transcription factor n=1 Tax=Colletotrichum kahawae TaxID=34407 RepID=A0AAD9Y7V9_COLKA|nr:C6 transcription factor [Colletotrichum kahawae]